MNSPAFAIAWEIWRRNRLGHLICIGCILVFALQAIAWAIFKPISFIEPALVGDGVVIVVFPMLATFIWLLNVFAHTEPDARRGFSGIPKRMFTLPIPTTHLVGCLMLYGVIAIITMYLAWALLVFFPFGIALPIGWPVLLLAVSMVSFQAAVWGLASFPLIRFGAIGFGATGLIALSAIVFGGQPPSWLPRSLAEVLMLMGIGLAYVGAVSGVNGERRGGWNAWLWLRPIRRRISEVLPRWHGPFETPIQAQLWFEWRRKGWILSAAMGLAIAGAVLFLPIAIVLDVHPSLPILSLLSVLLYPLCAAGSCGLLIAKSDLFARDTAISPFQAVRPLTDAELFRAKLVLTAIVTILGCLLGTVVILLVCSWTGWRGFWLAPVTEAGSPLAAMQSFGSVALIATVPAMIAVTWLSMIQGLSLGLTGRHRLIVAKSLIGTVLLVAIVLVAVWFYRGPAAHPLLGGIYYAAMAAIAFFKVRDTRFTHTEVMRQGLLSSNTYRSFVIIWMALGGCLLLWIISLWLIGPIPRSLLLFVVVMAWPAGELPRCVLHLESNRHG